MLSLIRFLCHTFFFLVYFIVVLLINFSDKSSSLSRYGEVGGTHLRVPKKSLKGGLNGLTGGWPQNNGKTQVIREGTPI